MRARFIRVSGIALTAFVLIGSAYANIIFTPGNLTVPETNIGVTAGPNGGAPVGTAINGSIASQGHGTVAIELTSDSDRLIGSNGGGNICGLTCTGNQRNLHNVTLQLPGFVFTHISLNPNGPLGPLTYTVFTCKLMSNDICVEEPQPFMTTVAPNSGQNRMNITADAFSSCSEVPGCVPGNEAIISVTLDVPMGITSLNQIRLNSDLTNPDVIDVVAEPSSMLLLGSGLLLLTQVLRRKLKLGFGTRSA